MVTAHATDGWKMDVDRGPDWVFVRLHPSPQMEVGGFSLAEQVWAVLEQSFTYRLVLEVDLLPNLQSYMIAQLVLLSKRIHAHDGLLRLCGLSNSNLEVIRVCRLDGCLPNYANRSDAVMGAKRPMQPR